MDDLQILVKAIVDSGSQSSMDSELTSIVEKLESKHKIELKVGLEDSSVQVVQTQLQAIARQVSSANRSGNTLQVFDTAQLQADGRKYFASTKTLVADVQKEFKSLGKVDVTNVFKNAKGDIQSFTASVTKADGTIERFNFNLAQIKDGAKTLKGFVQISSSLTDRNMGSGLNKTLDYLNKIEERVKTIKSKTLTDTSKPLTADMQEYSKFNAELERVTKRIAEIRSQNTAMTSDQKREIDSLVNGLQRYGRELQKTAYAANDLAAKTFSNQKAQLQAALETDIKKWNLSGVFTGDFKKSVEDAKATLNGAFDQSGLDAYKHKLELISQQFKQMKLDQSASGKILDADRLNTNIQSAQLRIQNLKQTYSALVNDPNLSAKWQSLFDESQIVSSQKELTNLNAKIRLFEQELINAGKHTQSFLDNFKANAVKMGTWMILGGVISGVMRGVTGLYDAVVEIDTAMVELKKVTNETDEAYDNFLTSAADKAIKIGTTYADFVSSTADFARLGYELEDAQGLAEVANIYAVVGDEVEGVDAATSSIISTMKAFNIEAEDAMLIADKFNEVGNNFAISSGGIGEAMARSASAMAAANNTIDESIALIVAANNVIQDPDVVGNMWKTVSMRIRGAKTELEEAGLETEYMAESTASLRKQIKALTNIDGLGGFDIMQDENTFKSTYDIILGISKVWKEMSDIDQAALLELLAGKRQGNALASAINNMDDAVKVLETSVDAEGSALAEHAKRMDSIQAKQQQFQAQYQAFANTILNSELVKFAYDTGTGLLGWLTELVDTLGALPTLVGAITPFFDKLQLFQKSSNKNWLGTGSGISFAWNIGKENLAKDLALLDDYNAKIVGLGNSTSDLQAKQIIWNDTIGQGSQSLKSMVKISDNAAVSSSAYKNAMTGAAASTKSVGVASKAAAVGVGVLRTALNMLLNIGITFAITSLISAFQSASAEAEELRQKTIAESEALVDTVNSFKDAYITAAQYGDRQELTASEERDFQYAVEQAAQALGDKKIAIDNATASTKDYVDALREASKEDLRTAALKANDASDAARDELKGIAYDDFYGEHLGFDMASSSIDKKSEEYKKAWKIVLDDLARYSTEIGITPDRVTIFGTIEGVREWNIEPTDFENVGEIVRYYYDLIDVKNKLNEAGLRETEIYDKISTDVEKLEDSVGKYVKSEYDRLSLNYMYQNGIPTDKEGFTLYRDYMQSAMSGLFDVDGMPFIVDSYLANESEKYAEYLGELDRQEGYVDTIAKKRDDIVSKFVSNLQYNNVYGAHSNSVYANVGKDLAEQLQQLSNEELNVAFAAVEDGALSWNQILDAVEAYRAEQEWLQTNAGKLHSALGTLWNSEDFADTRTEIQAMAKSVTGITADNVEELVAESEGLAAILEMDGMNAQFLANILQAMGTGGDGLALITNDALELNEILDGMVDSFDNVTAAKARYDAAMSVQEKDTNFRSYAEAFAELNAQFEAGTTNSNAFWAAAEFLFGSEQLAEWGWSDGLDEIYQAMDANRSVFEDADSAGAGFLDRLYELSEAGELVNDQGEKLIDITKNADGSFDFSVDPENIAEIASQMNLAEEAVLACFQALSMWGNINFYNVDEVITTLENITLAADTTSGKAVNLSRLTEQLLTLGKTDKEIHDIISALQGVDGITLLGVTDDVDTLIGSLTELGIVSGEGTEIEIDYTALVDVMQASGFAKEEVQALVGTLSAVDQSGAEEALAYIDTLTFDNVTQNLGSISDAIGDVDDSTTDGAVSELNDVASAATNAASQVASIGDAMDSLNGRTATMYYNVVRKDSVLGMFGFAKGTKNAPAGEALVGEEGVELWQSGDQARLVGVSGPEIVDLNEGDTIYTNAQTKQILSKSGKQIRGAIPAYKMGFNNRKLNSLHIKDTDYSKQPTPEPEGEVGGDDIIPAPYTPPNKKESGTGGGSSGNSEDTEKSFEDQYKEHQHMRQMDQESDEDYFNWLDQAYKEAYEKGEIELEEYWKYEEEVYKGRQDLFNDSLSDREHQISMLEHEGGNEKEIVSIYKGMISDIDAEIAAAKERGLDENSDYVQNLLKQRNSYEKAIVNIEDEINEKAKKAAEELVDFRIEMIKQELNDEKDALNDKLSALKKFYDKQKEMLKDQYDEEKYLEEQNEKRKAKADIEAELAQLEFDDSAWAQKRKIELQEELAEAGKDLEDFEKDHAYEQAQSLLDDAYEKQEELIQSQIDAIDEKLNDPNALYNQALNDIKNNTEELYQQMIDYNNQHGDGNPETVKEMWENAYIAFDDFFDLFGEYYKGIDLTNATGYSKENRSGSGYATGTRSATTGWHEIDEEGSEYIFADQGDRKYRMFSAGEKVLDADSADFLYDFAVSKGNMVDKLLDAFANAGDWIVSKIVGSTNTTENSIDKANKSIVENHSAKNEIKTGDIIIQGNADEKTISEIRREQRAGVKFLLQEFNRLNR